MNAAKLTCLLLFLLPLMGCSSVDPRVDNQQTILTAKLQTLLDAYNARHGTHVALPEVDVQNLPQKPQLIAAAHFASWSISVNQSWIKRNPCLVYQEAVAHELAHLLVEYQRYGAPMLGTIETRKGWQVVAFNEPPNILGVGDHDRAWQAVASELGANPCKEGYCKDAKPYSKYPLACPRSSAAWALVSEPGQGPMEAMSTPAADDQGKLGM